jgi:general L-amino acid transport system permease protein
MRAPPTPSSQPRQTGGGWRSRSRRAGLYQLIAVVLICLLLGFLAYNTSQNMRARGIQSGFDFLLQPAGFEIGESLWNFESSEAYWRAFAAGLGNTLRVALLGIVLTTLLGTLLGVGRFSRSILVRGLCSAYVELFRNIPLLLQLLMWYLLFTELLPGIDEAWQAGPFFLSKGGLNFPILGVSLWDGLSGSAPWVVDWPVKGEFSVEHGGALTPEFLALLLGLTVYTAAFVAEVVRAGIQSVAKGQQEAAAALGLRHALSLRLVVLPQALRAIIPPMTNQYLNLTKNSSLAVAIGYPDLLSIANTAINQTGRALECISVVMAVYLCTSLVTSFLMNHFNQRAALKSR